MYILKAVESHRKPWVPPLKMTAPSQHVRGDVHSAGPGTRGWDRGWDQGGFRGLHTDLCDLGKLGEPRLNAKGHRYTGCD